MIANVALFAGYGIKNCTTYYIEGRKGNGDGSNNAMIFALFAIVFLFICVEIGAIIFNCFALYGDTCRMLRCELIDRV